MDGRRVDDATTVYVALPTKSSRAACKNNEKMRTLSIPAIVKPTNVRILNRGNRKRVTDAVYSVNW